MLTYISETDYEMVDPMFRLIVHDHPRRFASLRLPMATQPVALCWRSELIEPLIVSDSTASTVWIGVDQRLACASVHGSTLLSLALSSSVLQIKWFAACVVALCEAQALAINHGHTIRRMCDLRETPDEVDVKGDRLVVTFVGGEKESFPI